MIVFVLSALAGYGDVVDGYPSADERWLHLWTNAARVAPEEFSADYAAGGCSVEADFSDDERTPKAPLYLDTALNEAARYHSADMAENGCFQHESCDGTDTWTRIARYYSEGGAMGENIAYGGVDGRYAVLSMWMCSHDGHRANIMSGDFNELGTGVAAGDGATLFTQDFAQGNVPPELPVRMGADDGSDFYADWGDAAPPAQLDLVLDGASQEMKLEFGTAEQGIYLASASISECTPYWFEWETEAGLAGSFPEDGAYLTGAGCEDIWQDRGGASGDGGDDDDELGDGDLKVVGCNSAALDAGWALLGGLGLLGRRRRQA